MLIFVYGGAWSAGSRATYASLGQRMAGLGFVAVVPDYVKYPEGTITDISSDVLRALLWLRREGAKQFGGASAAWLGGGVLALVCVVSLPANRPAVTDAMHRPCCCRRAVAQWAALAVNGPSHRVLIAHC